MLRSTSLALALLAVASPAFADGPAARPIDPTLDGLIIVGALAASLAPMALPLGDRALWQTQLLGALDASATDQLSLTASQLSDLLLTASVAVPAGYLTGSTIDDADGDRLLLYSETLAVDLALAQLAKYLIHRPRPYLYNTSAAARRLAAEAGDDAWRSFYSSHAAISFGAAVAGAYLLASSTTDPYARAAAWTSGFALAAATANLRVRAGRHFYSDVLVGGLLGTAVGYAVPALHARGAPYVPSRTDLAMAGAGLLGGLLLSEAIPLASATSDHPPPLLIDQLRVAPLTSPGAAGLSNARRVRSRWGRVPLSRHAVIAP